MHENFSRLTLSALMLLGGCSLKGGTTKPGEIQQGMSADKTAPQQTAPVKIDVKNAFVEDGDLKVAVVLTPLTDISADDVVVSIRGLNDGEVVREDLESIKETFPVETVHQGQKVLFRFGISAAGINEYQVAASWGEEAHQALKKRGPRSISENNSTETVETVTAPESVVPQSIPTTSEDKTEVKSEDNDNLAQTKPDEERAKLAASPVSPNESQSADTIVLANIKLERVNERCAAGDCPALYQLQGEVLNSTPLSATNITLALSLIWVEKGSEPVYPEDGAALMPGEEEIHLSDLKLAPGSSQKLRIKVDREIPSYDFGEFVPHLRLVSYERTSS